MGYCSGYSPNPVTVSDRLLIGYQIPFDTVNIAKSVARVGGTVTWQYWNGTNFASLTPATDTTSGLTATGTVTFLPPSSWTPHTINGSQSKYWVQITISGASTAPQLAKIYGDSLLTDGNARGWSPSTCVSGHINLGMPVEYCGTPHSGSTAKFRQQARAMGIGYYNYFFGNPINIQSSQNTWAYVEKVRTAATLAFPSQNGVMFDNAGAPLSQTPAFETSHTEVGSTPWLSAVATMFNALYTSLKATYGNNFWAGVNSYGLTAAPDDYRPIYTSMRWAMGENLTQTINGISMETQSKLYLCTNSLWCPGTATTNNPNGTLEYMQIQDYTQFGVRDGNGNSLSNYHLWDMAERGAMNALAEYYLVKNTNILFAYNPVGWVYNGFDDYYYWVRSARTVAAPGVTASTCLDGSGNQISCSVPISGALETSTCPGVQTFACPIRIGGVDVRSE